MPTPPPEEVARHRGEADDKDLPILVAAAAAGCRILVTFNIRDFHPSSLERTIETPAAFVERLRGRLRGALSQDTDPS